MRTAAICLLLFLPVSAVAAEPKKAAYEPTSNYPQQKIEGWTVYVNHRLLEDRKEVGQQVIKQLQVKLYDINRTLPEKVLEKLRQIPIWVEFNHPQHPCACYHPDKKWLIDNDFNPEKTKAVEIANAATFLKWIRQQPSMVLHELAHGYHDRFLGGYGNREIAAAYKRAMEKKSYESVLHWDGKMVRAYAANNPQEYFAELTEAWFGANDYYPFVRAEVIKHDPETAELLKKLWGEDDEKKPRYQPTSNYHRISLRGWTVYVNHRLREDKKDLGDEALELLQFKLYEVSRAVPAKPLARLREIPIWLEADAKSCCYHPSREWLVKNDYNPDKAKSVEVGNAGRFLQYTHEQPMVILHELAHGYHHRVLGHGHHGIRAAYKRAAASKSYEAVLRRGGKTARAYALSNEKEYFAELSEAWFGRNDFYPFVREEVKKHDPEMVKVLKEVWGE